MNKAFLTGRLTADPQSGSTNAGKTYVRFSLAVNSFGDRVDFINIVAWDKLAETAHKYLTKGRQVAIEGSIQVGSYERNGEKRTTFDVRADRIEFIGGSGNAAQKPNGDASIDELQPVDDDDDMPF